MKIQQLFEYNRQKTAEKMGTKLISAVKRDRNYWKWKSDLSDEEVLDSILEILEDIDPDRSKKHVQWLAKQYSNGWFLVEDAYKLKELLENFIRLKPALTRSGKSADINQYRLSELMNTIDDILDVDLGDEVTQSNLQNRQDIKVWYDGPLGQLVTPLTKSASCEFGRGTKWCTAGERVNYFDSYNEDGPLYIWRDKNGEKYQFWIDEQTGKDFQFMDSKDNSMFEFHWDTLDQYRHRHPVLKKLFKDILEPKILSVNYPEFAKKYGQMIPGGWSEELTKSHPEILSFIQQYEKFGAESSLVKKSLVEILYDAEGSQSGLDSTERYNSELKDSKSEYGAVLIEYLDVPAFLEDFGDRDAVTFSRSAMGLDDFYDMWTSYAISTDELENFIDEMPTRYMNELVAFLVDQDPDLKELQNASGGEFISMIESRDDLPGIDGLIGIMKQAINYGIMTGTARSVQERFLDDLEAVNDELPFSSIVYNRNSQGDIDLDQPVYLVVTASNLVRLLSRYYNGSEIEFMESGNVEDFIEPGSIILNEPGEPDYSSDDAYEEFSNQLQDLQSSLTENTVFERYETMFRKQLKANPVESVTDVAPVVKVHNTSVTDVYRDEIFGEKILTVDNTIKAVITLSILDDEVYIQNIQTAKDAQRQGYAKRLVDDLFREHPEKTITLSLMTDAGAKFFRSHYRVDDETGELTQRVSESKQEPDEPGYQHDLISMPKNTLVIDTPGELDWYKIGQHFPTLAKQDPHEYGQSESDMLISFANEREMKKFMKLADRVGLTVKNIGGTYEHPEIHTENFADGKVKGKSRPGRAKRAGVDCSKSVSELRKIAKNSSGEKQKMAHWCGNMKAGKKKS